MTGEQLLSNLASIGWKPGLTVESYDHIADIGFRGANSVLAAVAAELAEDCRPITLRGLFYRVVSCGALPSTSKKHYDRLGRVMSTLRAKGVVPYSWIVDNLRATIKPSSWSGLGDFADTVRDAYRKDFWAKLPSYVHIFCEKDAIAGVIAPVTQEYDVPLSPVRGYCSDSFAHEIGSTWCRIRKPIHAYYLGDYDPSGFDIERDLERKLRDHADGELRDIAEIPIAWQRLAVYESDFDEFDLIELEVKQTDKRYRSFIAKHGERCAEVDAVPPQVLRDRVKQAITSHIPKAKWSRLERVEQAEQKTFANLLSTIAEVQP